MAKRFTETGKWADKWFRALQPLCKLAWGYLCDNCDNAGVIDLDRDLADFQIGSKVDWDAFIKAAGPRIVALPRGKVWLAGFIAFQYGKLSPDCNPHKPVLAALEKHGLTQRVLEGLINPSGRAEDTDQAQDKATEKKEKLTLEFPMKLPELSDFPEPVRDKECRDAWQNWLIYKAKKIRQPYKTERGQRAELSAAAASGRDAFLGAIKLAMDREWRGVNLRLFLEGEGASTVRKSTREVAPI